jgi:hypothetical protein
MVRRAAAAAVGRLGSAGAIAELERRRATEAQPAVLMAIDAALAAQRRD